MKSTNNNTGDILEGIGCLGVVVLIILWIAFLVIHDNKIDAMEENTEYVYVKNKDLRCGEYCNYYLMVDRLDSNRELIPLFSDIKVTEYDYSRLEVGKTYNINEIHSR